jgi:hypothetical protein
MIGSGIFSAGEAVMESLPPPGRRIRCLPAHDLRQIGLPTAERIV